MKRAMKYDCLIIDDEKLLADSTAEYFNLFGVQTAVVYDAAGCRDFLKEKMLDKNFCTHEEKNTSACQFSPGFVAAAKDSTCFDANYREYKRD